MTATSDLDALDGVAHHPTMEPVFDDSLPAIVDHALRIVLRMLSARNEDITAEHTALLRATCETLTRAAFGELPHRVIIGLPTGAGKTTCVAGVLFALNEYGKLHEAPVMILAEQIRAGQELYELLLDGYGSRTGLDCDADTGIDEKLVCHVHGEDGTDPQDADGVPIVIATHARSRMAKDIARLHAFEGSTRGVWIDEGLLASSSFGLRLPRVQTCLTQIATEAAARLDGLREGRLDAAARLERRGMWREADEVRQDPGDDEAACESMIGWAALVRDQLDAAVRQVTRMVEAKKINGKSGEVHVAVKLAEPQFDIDLGVNMLPSSRQGTDAKRLVEAAAFNAASFTLVAHGSQHVVLQHARVLPELLDANTIVLDAGEELDALQDLDSKLVGVEGLAWWPKTDDGKAMPAAALKDWSDVTLLHMNTGGGRSTLEKRGRLDDLLDATAAMLVERAEVGDEVLVCTYMAFKPADVVKRIKRKLGALRRDLRVAVDGDTRPECDLWLRSLHWGLHHSTNEYQDARIVIALGDFPVGDEDLEAMVLGQRNTDSTKAPDRRRLTGQGRAYFHDSYVATKLLQLAGRGRSRQVVNGKAREMVFAFTSNRCATNRHDPATGEPLRSTVEMLHRIAMPGAKLETWAAPARLEEAKKRSAEAGRANLDAANAGRAEAPDVFAKYMRPKIESGEVREFAARHAREAFGIPRVAHGGPSRDVVTGALDILAARRDVEVIETKDRADRAVRSFVVSPF